MRRTLDVCLRVGAVLCALMWAISSATKLAAPIASYELVALVIGVGVVGKAVFAAVVGGEALLAVFGLLGLSPRRLLWVSLAALVFLTVALFAAKGHVGGDVPCGCMPSVLDTDIDGAVARNSALIGFLAVLLGLDLAFARSGAAADVDVAN